MESGKFELEESTSGIEAWRLNSNGLRVLIAPQAIAPIATVMITYLVGSGDERPGHTGATHFLEHLMFKGSEQFNPAKGTDIFELLQSVGAQVNATTSKDRTNYYATLPVQYLELALQIEADRMRNALLDTGDMEAERTVILNELDRGLNDPIHNLYKELWSTAYTTHPYHHPVIGWRKDVESISQDTLRKFYDTYYWPDNATLSVVGAVDRGEILSLVSRHFGGLPPMPVPPQRPRTTEPAQAAERRITKQGPGHVSVLMIGYRVCEALHQDAAALSILELILASGKSSRLWRRLTDTGLAAQVAAGAMPSRDPGLFHVMAMLVPGRTHAEVEAEIHETIEELQETGPTPEELRRAQSQLAAQEAFMRDGVFGMAAVLNEAIAAGDWRLFAFWREHMERVTASDVTRVAQAYLRPDRRTVAILGPRGG